ncbi:MAG TPA: ATP-binding cassette domain-containing protein [Actinomycetota bacterium]|nr:ATP-binding cassette domain-containing protein [Actinomycetota bacterium]
MIELRSVAYRYPGAGTSALDNLDLATVEGELLLVCGRSGNGKSTLLKTMNGLVPRFYGGTFSGSVRVNGVDMQGASARDFTDRVGFVNQFPEDQVVIDRVEDDICFTLENLGVERLAMRKRLEEVLDAVGVAHLRARRIRTLSSGERQRVAIAGALVAFPSHLVLDEPTSQLDPQSAEEVISAALNLRDELGITLIVSEHRLDRILQYADRLCYLEAGHLLQPGDPAIVLHDTDIGPPVVQLGRTLGWMPLPLSIRETRARFGSLNLVPTAPRQSPSPGDIVVSAHSLTAGFGDIRALRGVDLGLHRGEVVALMGRNGSGKSTLLRAMAGLSKTTGEVQRFGSVALLPQNPEQMLFRRTVSDEIRHTLIGRGRDASQRSVQEVAERFGITDLLNRYPRDLSGGEKTKVSLAAIAAGDPDIILLDEPTRGVDQPTKAALAQLLDLWRAEGRTVLMATHDVELAAEVSTRVLIMAEGEIIVDGDPSEVLGNSLTFATQMNKVSGDPHILTLQDAVGSICV